MPATTRVVQIEPGPIPTLTQFTPAFISASVAAPVATLPAIICKSGYASRTIFITLSTLALCPCAVSITTQSTCFCTSASTRSSILAVTPTAAPHNSLPCESFAARGYLICFSISFMVIRPVRQPSSSTNGSFSFLDFASICFASSSVIPWCAVISPSEVIDSLIFLVKSVSNFKSLFVIIPTSFLPSVTGTPEILNFAIRLLASSSVCSGDK